MSRRGGYSNQYNNWNNQNQGNYRGGGGGGEPNIVQAGPRIPAQVPGGSCSTLHDECSSDIAECWINMSPTLALMLDLTGTPPCRWPWRQLQQQRSVRCACLAWLHLYHSSASPSAHDEQSQGDLSMISPVLGHRCTGKQRVNLLRGTTGAMALLTSLLAACRQPRWRLQCPQSRGRRWQPELLWRPCQQQVRHHRSCKELSRTALPGAG